MESRRGNAQRGEPIGSATDKIDVRLSYRIVELSSEGLYASPNKAVEELVANAFDAGAQTVQIFLSTNLHDQDATVVVIDDGEGMGVEGSSSTGSLASATSADWEISFRWSGNR